MYHEEATIKIIGKAILEFFEIDQNKLRNIIEGVLYNYEMQPQTKALTTLSDVYDRIVDYLIAKKLAGISKNTIYNYKLQLIKFSTYIRKNVNDIEAIDVRIYMATIMKEKHLKETSMSSMISILKSFFSWLFIQGYVDKNIMEKIENIKCEKRLRKPLDVIEIERLRNACDTPRKRSIFETFIGCGIRLSELQNINVGDLNWSDGSFIVNCKGKERTVFFNDKSRYYIKKYLNTRENLTNDSPLFITSKFPFRRLGRRAIECEVKKIANQAGFEKSIFPHLFRHSYSSNALRSGCPITTIQKLLGHSSVATTMIYAQTDNNTVKQEYNKYFSV